jgi:predicted transcriptional regulator
MEKKQRKLSRINFYVRDECRQMLDELADKSDRSMTSVIEKLIKVEYSRVKDNASKGVL